MVEDAFGRTSSGCVRLEADRPVMAVSRTFNQQPQGTYGQVLAATDPGRSFAVGDAGILVGSVIYTKTSGSSEFLIIDAAMNDFLRPSMYDAYHPIVGGEDRGAPEQVYDIVGPVCETGDTFARRRRLPEQQPGDLVVIEACGAYGSVMASTYNTRPLITEVMVERNEFRVIRRRPDYDSMIAIDLPWESAS